MVFTQRQQADIKSVAKSVFDECVNLQETVGAKSVKQRIEEYFSEAGVFDELADRLANNVLEKLEHRFKQFENLIDNCNRLETRVGELQVENEELYRKLDNFEQYSRRNCIRMFGIEESQREDPDDTVINVIKTKLNIDISKQDIDRCHRIGSVKSNPQKKPRPLIVKFVSYRCRNMVFSNKRKLKGSNIVIREDLTKNRMDILNCAIEKYGYRNVWTRDGKICINHNNKIIMVESLKDLEKHISA